MQCHATHINTRMHINTYTYILVLSHTHTRTHTPPSCRFCKLFAAFHLLCLSSSALSRSRRVQSLGALSLSLLCSEYLRQCQWGPRRSSVVASVIVVVFLRSLRFISFRFCGLSARVCKKLFQSRCRCRCCRPQHTPACVVVVFFCALYSHIYILHFFCSLSCGCRCR